MVIFVNFLIVVVEGCHVCRPNVKAKIRITQRMVHTRDRLQTTLGLSVREVIIFQISYRASYSAIMGRANVRMAIAIVGSSRINILISLLGRIIVVRRFQVSSKRSCDAGGLFRKDRRGKLTQAPVTLPLFTGLIIRNVRHPYP